MAPRTSTAPVRTCIGCRRRDLASALVRVVRSVSSDTRPIVVDEAGKLPGRGAWLHRNSDCVSAAVRRKAFGPALRDRGFAVTPHDLADLIDEITETIP